MIMYNIKGPACSNVNISRSPKKYYGIEQCLAVTFML